MRHFKILIVSAVKICKQCLQTATASKSPGGQAPTGAVPLDPTGNGELPSPDHPAIAPKCKFLATPLHKSAAIAS